MKIINVGRFPPPIGGIAYFLQRLKSHLEKENLDNLFYDISGISYNEKRKKGVICTHPFLVFFMIFFQSKSLVVFHSNGLMVLIMANILSIKHKIVLFTHGESILRRKDQGIIFRMLLKNIDFFATPTKLIYNNLLSQFPEYKEKIYNIPFILFPKKIDKVEDGRILELRKKSKYIMVGYAYDLNFINEVDLYGVDMMFDLLIMFKNSKIDASLLLILPTCTNKEYLRNLWSKIELNKLNDKILVLNEKVKEATSIYELADVYLRPTVTDGDSFSVWESLYVKTPVVASDASQRPEQCILFENRNIYDFFKKTKYALDNIAELKEKLDEASITGSEKELINFFKGCMD